MPDRSIKEEDKAKYNDKKSALTLSPEETIVLAMFPLCLQMATSTVAGIGMEVFNR